MDPIIQHILAEFEQEIDLRHIKYYEQDGERRTYVKTAYVRTLSARYYKEVAAQEKTAIFALCEEMLTQAAQETAAQPSGCQYLKTIAFDWAFRLKKRYDAADFDRFERWVYRHLRDWGDCDDLCTHAVAECLQQYPEALPRLKTWARASNWRVRRAAAVALIPLVKRALHIELALEIADLLLEDEEDLVRKGYGWLLKVASVAHQDVVFRYVLAHKDAMPRVALRYAIEKMPPGRRQQAMAKSVR